MYKARGGVYVQEIINIKHLGGTMDKRRRTEKVNQYWSKANLTHLNSCLHDHNLKYPEHSVYKSCLKIKAISVTSRCLSHWYTTPYCNVNQRFNRGLGLLQVN